MGYLRPKSGLRKKNFYFGVEFKIENSFRSWILRVLKFNFQYVISETETKGNKNDLQSSQQWDILDRCIRLKISATVEQ